MATSNDRAASVHRDPTAQPDIISSILYRLRLRRIGIEKDIRAHRSHSSVVDHTPADLHEEMFQADRLLLSAERLAEVATRAEFFTGLQDVLANLVGTENFAVFEPSKANQTWVPTVHCGASAEAMHNCTTCHTFLTALRTRELVSNAAASSSPVLVTPLLAGREVAAVLAIFEWLPQKQFDTLERERILEMLRLHGGEILRTVGLHNGREA